MEAADFVLEVVQLDGSSLRIACLNEDNVGAFYWKIWSESPGSSSTYRQYTLREGDSDQPLDVDVSLVTLDGRKIYLIAKSDPYCLLFIDMDAECRQGFF
jgi:hypothetical protein